MKKTMLLAGLLVSVLFAADEPKEPSVEKIVKDANRVAYYQGADGKAKVKMAIIDSQKRERVRELIILRKDALDESLPEEERSKDDSFCEGQKIYAYFMLPADVSKTVFMVWKNTDKDDDRWMYLPALDLVKRISATDKRTSFVGSDFFYEDVSGRSINDDTHELISTDENYYVLKNTPKDKAGVEFAYYKMWIHKTSSVVVKTEYYDSPEAEKPYRLYEALGVTQIGGYNTVIKSKMTDLRSGAYTTLEYSDVQYNIGLEDDVFTERYLRKPARKYLR